MTTASWWWAKSKSVESSTPPTINPPILVDPAEQDIWEGKVYDMYVDNIGGAAESWVVDWLPNGLSSEDFGSYLHITGTVGALRLPVITDPGQQEWYVGESIDLTVDLDQVAGDPADTITATPLLSGLSITESSQWHIRITGVAGVPIIDPATIVDRTYYSGQSFDFLVTNIGSGAALLSADQLPDGLVSELVDGFSLRIHGTIVGGTVPVIEIQVPQYAEVDQSYSLQLSASESPTSWDATGLPTGLTIDDAGLISGTPTVREYTQASITATNSLGTSTPLLLDFTIHGAATDAPDVVNPGDQTITAGEVYVLNVRNLGGPITTWDVRDGWLPSSLAVVDEQPYYMKIQSDWLNISPIAEMTVRPTTSYMYRAIDQRVEVASLRHYNQYIFETNYQWSFSEAQPLTGIRHTVTSSFYELRADTTGDGSFDTLLVKEDHLPRQSIWGVPDWTWAVWDSTVSAHAIQLKQLGIWRFTKSGQNGTPPQIGDTVYCWQSEAPHQRSGVIYDMDDTYIWVNQNEGEGYSWYTSGWLVDSETDNTNRWEYSANEDAGNVRSLYDIQMFGPKSQLSQETKDALDAINNPVLEADVPVQAATDISVVPPPTSEQEYIKGMYIEVWMAGLPTWIQTDEPRPPLRDEAIYQANLVRLNAMSANMVWLMPVRSGFVDGSYTGNWYSSEVLWPSDYIALDSPENYLTEICNAYQGDGFMVFAGDRPSSYTPETGVAQEDVIPGMAGEMAAAGCDGVAVCFDEAYSFSDATRDQWSRAADNIKAEGKTTFTNLAFANQGSNRQVGPFGRDVDTDLLGSSSYFTRDQEYDHWKGPAKVREYIGANPNGGYINTANVAWAPLDGNPLYYQVNPGITIYGIAVSCAFAGSEANAYWRLQYQNDAWTDQWVPIGYKMLDTLAAWGGKSAIIPEQILTIRSDLHTAGFESRDVSNDYYNEYPTANKIGNRNSDSLNEVLHREGLPYHVRQLMLPERWPDYNNYEVIVCAFAYQSPWSDPVPPAAAAYFQAAADAGVKVIFMDRGDQVGNWTYFDGFDTLSSPNIIMHTDRLEDGLTPTLYNNLRDVIVNNLSQRPTYLNNYSRDIELQMMKGTGTEDGNYYLLVSNWQDADVTVDVGITVPTGNYTVLQRDLVEVRTATIDDSTTWTAADLAKFRVDLELGEIKIFYIQASP